MITIEKLGKKICIIGPSSSGKSTLAYHLSKKLNVPVFHLDKLAHMKNTNWQRKPDSEFLLEHKQAIDSENWVIDGNYSICMSDRFNNADSIIWLEFNIIKCVFRYIKRSIINDSGRHGNLEGSAKQFGWYLIKYTLFNYPKNKIKYQTLINNTDVFVLKIKTMKELESYYKLWDI